MTTLLFNKYQRAPFHSFLDDVLESSNSKANIVDHPDKIEIIAEIPGFSKDEVSIDLKENVLSIKTKESKTTKTEDSKYILQELSDPKFNRSFKLSDNFDLNKIKASFTNGLLHVDVSKKKPEKPKKIKIV
jgi:HSP20 family protein